MTDQQLRDRIAQAIASVTITIGPNSLALLKNGHTLGLTGGETDAMALSALAVMQPELDRLRAELAAARDKASAHEHSENLLAGILRDGRRLLGEAATPEQAVADLHTLLNP